MNVVIKMRQLRKVKEYVDYEPYNDEPILSWELNEDEFIYFSY